MLLAHTPLPKHCDLNMVTADTRRKINIRSKSSPNKPAGGLQELYDILFELLDDTLATISETFHSLFCIENNFGACILNRGSH